MPWITVVDSTYATAAPSVPNMHASGTSRFGFSTASEFCAADSMPRKAQRVSAMLEPMPCNQDTPFGFEAGGKVSGLTQTQPMRQSIPTGMSTPHTVTDPILPVTPAPPKLATVASQSRPITPRGGATGGGDSQGMNAAR